MSDGPGQTVDDGLLIFVDMAVGVGDAVGVEVGVIVFMVVFVKFGLTLPSFIVVKCIILRLRISRNPPRGII